MTDNTQPEALRDARWYMVTHDGVATLCEDRRDAEKEAKDADMAWPHSGPHRAVQLVEVGTAGFTAADMATAAAQGFRDGVASLAANAGEPVAHLWQHCETGRTRVLMPDTIVDADASWRLIGPLFLGSPPSPPEGMVATDAMIDAGKKMLHNSNGRGAREKVERIFNAMLEAAAAASAGSGKGE